MKKRDENNFVDYYNYLSFAEDCYLFNDLAGKSRQSTWKDLQAQYDLIQEETSEILEGIENRDIIEVLDGAVDVLVVTIGLLQKLQSKGIDVSLALKLVAENNLSKFTEDKSSAEDTVEQLKMQGIEASAEYQPFFDVYVIKDTNGKVRKPIDFESVYLLDCVPSELVTEDWE